MTIGLPTHDIQPCQEDGEHRVTQRHSRADCPATWSRSMTVHDARAYLTALDTAAKEIENTSFPELVLLDGVLHCPYCRAEVEADGLVLLDWDTRWNYVGEYEVDPGRGGRLSVKEGERNYQDLAYRVECCHAPVDVPEGWEASW